MGKKRTSTKTSTKSILLHLRQNYVLYLFILPSFIYVLTFSYAPLYGIQIAFKNFRASSGIWNSPWVGLKNFQDFVSSYNFWLLIKNTLSLSFYSLIAGFPIPIILALAINHSVNKRLAKITQSITYAPHFISTVVLVGMLAVFLSPSTGFVNKLISMAGIQPIYFMGSLHLFQDVYVWSGIWQNMGWSSVIYIAALSGVPPEHHEAAIVDGATKLMRIWHIDLPHIMPTAVILLILSCGSIMNVGFEKVLLMQNDVNLQVSEVISTFVYKMGLQNARYSYSAAIGLFNNVINFIVLVSVNRAARAISDTSLW